MRKLFILFVLLLFALPSPCAVPVTGNLKDIATGAVSSGSFVRFELTKCGANIPRITGTSILVSKVKDFRPDASGAISGNLYGNNEIECGGVTDNSCYDMSVYYGNTRQSTVHVKVYSPGFNVNSFSPASECGSTPIVAPATPKGYIYQNPDGDQTVNQPAGTVMRVNNLSSPSVLMVSGDQSATGNKTFSDITIKDAVGSRCLQTSPAGKIVETAGACGTAEGAVSVDGIDISPKSVTTATANGEVWALADIKTSIDALPEGGGTVRLKPNTTYSITCESNQVTTGTKVVDIVGSGETSIIQGHGCALVTLASTGSKIRNLKIVQDVADDATVGVLVASGRTAGSPPAPVEVTRWAIENVYFESTDKLKGTAIKTRFGLEGHVIGGETRGWNYGVELTAYNTAARSNANHFIGTKIRWGNTGIYIPADSVDDVWIEGSVIEGNNNYGINASSGLISVSKTHFENTTGSTGQVNLAGDARIVSIGNFYGRYPSPSANLDIVTDAADNYTQLSVGDTLNDGITHNNTTSPFMVDSPVISVATAGAGTVVTRDHTHNVASNENQAYLMSGFAYFDLRMPIVNTQGDTKVFAHTGRKVAISNYTGATKIAEFDPATQTTALFGPVVLSNMSQGGKALCQKSDKSIGYCSSAPNASGVCTCN